METFQCFYTSMRLHVWLTEPLPSSVATC